MNLIERYLHAVKTSLPAGQQDDVVAELRVDLESRVEEREAALGRALTDEETSAILKQLGRPMLLAARYRPQPALVGQALMPYYWQTLKISLGIAVLVKVVIATAVIGTGRPVHEGLRGLISFPFETAPALVGWVTLVFFALTRAVTGRALTDSWDPSTLPQVPRDGRAPSRVPIVGDMVGVGLLAAWWLVVPGSPFLLLGPAAAYVTPGPGWHAMHLPVAALMLLAIGLHAIALVRPALRLPMRVGAHVLALAGIGLLVARGELLAPLRGPGTPADLSHVMRMIDAAVGVALGVALVITLIEMGRDLWRLRRARRAGPVAASASTRQVSPR